MGKDHQSAQQLSYAIHTAELKFWVFNVLHVQLFIQDSELLVTLQSGKAKVMADEDMTLKARAAGTRLESSLELKLVVRSCGFVTPTCRRSHMLW